MENRLRNIYTLSTVRVCSTYKLIQQWDNQKENPMKTTKEYYLHKLIKTEREQHKIYGNRQ